MSEWECGRASVKAAACAFRCKVGFKKKNRIYVRGLLKCGKGGRLDAREEDRNLICVQIFCICLDCVCVGGWGGGGEQQPRQCGGTSFISAHLVCSHSSLTPLTDELQRLAKLPADSALARSPSAQPPTPSATTLLQHHSLRLVSGGL